MVGIIVALRFAAMQLVEGRPGFSTAACGFFPWHPLGHILRPQRLGKSTAGAWQAHKHHII
jgi:hypothetical protein